MKKKIKTNSSLAADLWSSGNHDARVLATMVASNDVDNKTIEAWSRDLDNYVIADAFSALVARSPRAQTKMAKWTKAKGEWVGQAGWTLVARIAINDNELPDAYFIAYLKKIEQTIHRSKNRVRYAMNNALIAIGSRSTRLEKAASAAARRIGKVEVDHGETGCKTPDAVAYIARARAHREKKKK
jgi:3-methyladenine DNA glycosylase AlkD